MRVGLSKYLAVWDTDEFWFPPATLFATSASSSSFPSESLASIKNSLADYMERKDLVPGCENDWCFITFHSRNTCGVVCFFV